MRVIFAGSGRASGGTSFRFGRPIWASYGAGRCRSWPGESDECQSRVGARYARFFASRMRVPWLQPSGSLEATSYYDSSAQVNATRRSGALSTSSRLPSGGFQQFDGVARSPRTGNAVGSARLPLSIPEFLSTKNATDIRFSFGPSSLSSGYTHSNVGEVLRPRRDRGIAALRRSEAPATGRNRRKRTTKPGKTHA
jgi:hypothetical protein